MNHTISALVSALCWATIAGGLGLALRLNAFRVNLDPRGYRPPGLAPSGRSRQIPRTARTVEHQNHLTNQEQNHQGVQVERHPGPDYTTALAATSGPHGVPGQLVVTLARDAVSTVRMDPSGGGLTPAADWLTMRFGQTAPSGDSTGDVYVPLGQLSWSALFIPTAAGLVTLTTTADPGPASGDPPPLTYQAT